MSPRAESPRRRGVEHDDRTQDWTDEALECRMERRHLTPPLRRWKREFRRERIPGTRRVVDTVHLEAECRRCKMRVKVVRERYGGRRMRGSYKPSDPNYYAPPGTGPIPYEAVWGEYVRRFLDE